VSDHSHSLQHEASADLASRCYEQALLSLFLSLSYSCRLHRTTQPQAGEQHLAIQNLAIQASRSPSKAGNELSLGGEFNRIHNQENR